MTSPSPEERIGSYRVHPVASLFPILKGEEFEKFKISIQERGQLEPIVVQNDVLLDGRNRLRACLDLKIEPKITEFGEGDTLKVTEYILAENISRRHLTPELRIILVREAHGWMMIKKEAEERQSQGRREGGRGHKKTLPTNVDKVSESRQRHARSTEGQIATLTKTSRRTVSETIRVLDHGSPELVQQLKQGEISAHNAVKKLSPKKQANKPTKKLTRALQIEVSLKSQIEFLERIRAQAFTRLKEAEAIGKRSWNIENSSKVALARGLNEILNEVNERLNWIRTQLSINPGQSVTGREDATNQPTTGRESVN